MHTSTELRSDSFSIELDGRPATIADVLPDAGANGRLGIVVREPCGAVGASLLLLAAITAFYDAQRARSDQFYIYPDYFLFHVGRPHGDHSMLDVFPSHKEVIVPDDPQLILQAINDRAITWLVVPEREPAAAPQDREGLASARDRIVASFSYSPTGRVAEHGDVRIAGNEATESCVRAVLDPEGVVATLGDAEDGDHATLGDPADPYAAELTRRAGEVAPETRAQLRADRDRLRENGRPLESYRRLTLDQALGSLGSNAAVDSPGQNR
jgi:hypothetical protein